MGGHGPAERPTCGVCNCWADQCRCEPRACSGCGAGNTEWHSGANAHLCGDCWSEFEREQDIPPDYNPGSRCGPDCGYCGGCS